MAELEHRMFCRLDGLTPPTREQKRLTAIKELGLLQAEAVAVFEEATQTAARFLDAPICILGIMTTEQQWIKSAIGLSRAGLMNPLAQSRQLPRQECFCAYVVDSKQVLAIQDTATHPVFARSLLVAQYGIRAYLGVPLLTADGLCLGTLAVMDLVPHHFSSKDAEFLAITARWSLSEFERNRLLQHSLPTTHQLPQVSGTHNTPTGKADESNLNWDISNGVAINFSATHWVKVKLLSRLAQELRTPLTSVMGMASVLNQEIYGPLIGKQKEYLEIIHDSGEQLVSLVDEIVALGFVDETPERVTLAAVDVEMLCQHAINSLSKMAQGRQQQIRLTLEPGSRIGLLDKDKVRQMLYYLLFSVIYAAEPGGEVRIHVSRKSDTINIATWISHPWLGEGLPPVYGGIAESLLSSAVSTPTYSEFETALVDEFGGSQWAEKPSASPMNSGFSSTPLGETLIMAEQHKQSEPKASRETLGLFLSCYLAELHGGDISIQGSSDLGYRYVVSLPQSESAAEQFSLESSVRMEK